MFIPYIIGFRVLINAVESKGRKVDSKRRDKTPPSNQVTKEQSISVGNLDSGSRLRDYGDSKTRRRSNLKSFITSSQNRSILDLSDSRKKIGESSISGSSSHSRSESVSEEEAYYGGCLEDWHAFADAINANEKQQNMFSASPPKPHIGIDCIGSEQPKKKGVRKKRVNTGSDMNSHLCPLCCEDLDATDLSFLPCSCGYQLCLFCHKLILEQDGRCPNCRKQYDPVY